MAEIEVDYEPGIDSGNGHHEEESPEQLQAAVKKLDALTRGTGSVVSLTKQELGLMQTLLRTTTEKYREETLWRMADFLDDDQALDHVAAYYEAKELGMDTSFNVAFVFALCSVNRKGAETNLLSSILDSLQMAKHAGNTYRKDERGSNNPRSPIG